VGQQHIAVTPHGVLHTIIHAMTLSDLLQLLANFMQPVTKDNVMYDLNGDGIISTTYLIILLSQLL
jgi:hypothetical protein